MPIRPTPSRAAATSGDTTRAEPTPLRIREAIVAAFALVCFSVATPAGGTVLAQVQPGAPAPDARIGDPAQAVAVEVALRMEGGALVCRPDLARLPSNQELTLQLANQSDRAAAFSAPAFFAAGTIVAVTDAEYATDDEAFVVPAGTTAQITFTSAQEGVYAYGCAPAGEEAAMQGEFVVED